MCRNHYMQKWRRGLGPLVDDGRRSTRPLKERVSEKFIAREGEECWLWIGRVNGQGYGVINVNGTPRSAHRVVYELMVAPIPNGLTADHICHDPGVCTGGSSCIHRRCVNPSHLALVTPADNARRQASRLGIHPARDRASALLGPLLSAGLSVRAAAAQIGVSERTAYRAIQLKGGASDADR